jgi:phosphosulfolactate synthase (CoM biosynthesis protein A)
MRNERWAHSGFPIGNTTNAVQAYQLSEMHRELEKWTNQARFVQMIVDGKLVVSKKRKTDLVAELKQKGFKGFPKVKDAIKEGELEPIADNDEEIEADIETGANAYDYLLGVSDKVAKHALHRTNYIIDAYLVVDQRASREVVAPNWR